ncbi:MAG TPA: hypothetical protein VMV10_09115 [Pirellulales bacterium]|nr:hypothetical protein [Pirellulales bacterium]
MSRFSSQGYGPAVAALLAPERLNELGPGTPNRVAGEPLASLSAESLAAPHAVVDRRMAAACQSALWLYHDFLDESHAISQELDTIEGSYWHGILHRREPDYTNAKYWFRRVGSHPIGPELAAAARALAEAAPADRSAEFLNTQAEWDHFRFVDLCQAATAGRSAAELLCRRIQQREWELLFDYCYRRACADAALG